MDESWRMKMGVGDGNGKTRTRHRRSMTMGPELEISEVVGGAAADQLDIDDFDDVFGGPPKSVLARKLSADFTANDWFYQEIFKQPEDVEIPAFVKAAGRRLPEFVIPEMNGLEFQGKSGLKSKFKCKGNCMTSKSKSTSSSVLSFEEMSLPDGNYASIGDHSRDKDVDLSSFTCKLRPINAPSRWSSSGLPRAKNVKKDLPAFGCNNNNTITNTQFTENSTDQCNDNYYMLNSFNQSYGFPQRVNSPETETINIDNYDYDYDYVQEKSFVHDEIASYEQREVIEINSRTNEVNNSGAIDISEAIAWAKEKFQGWSLDDRHSTESNMFGEIQGDN